MQTISAITENFSTLQDELSDVSQAGSKSTTPASTAAETPLNEDQEGLVKSSSSVNKKLDITKHIEVQVAQETRSVSIGKLLMARVVNSLKPKVLRNQIVWVEF